MATAIIPLALFLLFIPQAAAISVAPERHRGLRQNPFRSFAANENADAPADLDNEFSRWRLPPPPGEVGIPTTDDDSNEMRSQSVQATEERHWQYPYFELHANENLDIPVDPDMDISSLVLPPPPGRDISNEIRRKPAQVARKQHTAPRLYPFNKIPAELDAQGIRAKSVQAARQHRGVQWGVPFSAIPAEPHVIANNPTNVFEPLPPPPIPPPTVSATLPMDNANELRVKSLQEPQAAGNLPTAHPLIIFSPVPEESHDSKKKSHDREGGRKEEDEDSNDDEDEARMTSVEGLHRHKSHNKHHSKSKKVQPEVDSDDVEEEENEMNEDEQDENQSDEEPADETRKPTTKKSTTRKPRPEFEVNPGQGISIYSWEDHVASMQAGQDADEAFQGDDSESSEEEEQDDRQEEDDDADDGLKPTKEDVDESAENDDSDDEDEDYEVEKKSIDSHKKSRHKSSKSGSCSHSENTIVQKLEGIIGRITGKLTKKVTILPNDRPSECFHNPWKPSTMEQSESCYRAWGMTQKVSKCWAKEETTKWQICAVDCGFMGQKQDSAPCHGCLAHLGHQKRSCSFTALGVGMKCQNCRETAYHHYDRNCIQLCKHAFDQAYGESPSPECRSCSENFHTMLDDCS